MKDGKLLKDYLRINDITIEAFINKVSISKATVYKWFDMDDFDEVIFGKIFKDGHIPKDLFQNKKEKSVNFSGSENQTTTRDMNNIERLKMENEELKNELLQAKNKIIELLEERQISPGKRKQN